MEVLQSSPKFGCYIPVYFLVHLDFELPRKECPLYMHEVQ